MYLAQTMGSELDFTPLDTDVVHSYRSQKNSRTLLQVVKSSNSVRIKVARIDTSIDCRKGLGKYKLSTAASIFQCQ